MVRIRNGIGIETIEVTASEESSDGGAICFTLPGGTRRIVSKRDIVGPA